MTTDVAPALVRPPVVALDGGHLIRGPWGWTQVPQRSVEDLVTFTGLGEGEVLHRLAAAHPDEQLADEWRHTDPASQAAMRAFYGSTNAYLWSLTVWTATRQYEWYRAVCRRLAERQVPQGRPLRALDYGSGIGETAISLSELGYDVTIADVPGQTFAFAQHRLRRRGIPFTAITITQDLPSIAGTYDAIVVFDVLEHVRKPDQVFLHLLRHLAPSGLLAEASAFDDVEGDYEGVHLAENGVRWGGGRWRLFVSGQGLRSEWGCIHQRAGGAPAVARRLQYGLWRMTGLDVRYRRRRP